MGSTLVLFTIFHSFNSEIKMGGSKPEFIDARV
jgi:hypothetical protein